VGRRARIEDTSLESLSTDEQVRAAVQEGVDAANAKLARVEQIKKFAVVHGDWLPGGDELTPTMKLKRKPIAEKYAQRSTRCTPADTPRRRHLRTAHAVTAGRSRPGGRSTS